MSRTSRTAIGGLAVSAAALLALWDHEGWTERAIVPVKGDVPTVGPGLTKREDGTPVQMGDTVTPLQGARRSLSHLQKDERGIKACVTAPLSQAEYDLMLKFAYQYGVKTLCASTVVREANAGNYTASCEGYKLYRFVGKGKDRYDCSTLVDGKPNKRCWGVWKRSNDNYTECMGAQ